MAINTISAEQAAASAAAVAAANNGKTAASGTGIGSDFSFFLKMLTTQLSNQDPTAPMDVTQMTQQIAQYSGVEQQVKTNSTLEKLIASNKQSQLSTAVSYIGKEVETDGNVGTLKYAQNGGEVGTAQFTYTLPKDVVSTTVTIENAKGEVVYSGTGTGKEGPNTINWDGVSSITKKQVAAGDYTIKVVPKDASGNPLSTEVKADSKLAYAEGQFGQAVFSYMLPTGAQGAKVTILNASGQAVFTGDGTLETGRNVVVWDGVNSFNGNYATAGKYTIQVTAKDATGKDITVETRAVGTVNTVETDAQNNIVLNVGDAQVKYADILAVREATPFYVPNPIDKES